MGKKEEDKIKSTPLVSVPGNPKNPISSISRVMQPHMKLIEMILWRAL